MQRIAKFITLFGLLLLSTNLFAANPPSQSCPPPEVATTRPSKVDFGYMLQKLDEARTQSGIKVFEVDQEMRDDLEDLFDNSRATSKMEQLYATLFTIQMHSPLPAGEYFEIQPEPMRDILTSAGVTPDERFAKLITKIRFKKSSLTPYWEITFAEPEVRFPLNQGKGFRTFHHGLCQEAKALVFSSPFSFYIKKNKKGNIEAYKFNNVDIEGVFGTRGIVDIDLNYVTLVSLIFLRGTALGLVEGKVAEREFEVNDHSWILRTINRFFSNTTRQAIDW